MAPMKKFESAIWFIYEKNNFASCVNIDAVEETEFHMMMNFIKASQLSHAMLSTPTIYHKVVHETISFTLKNKTHTINCDVMNACFKILENTVKNLPSDAQLVNLLNAMNYALPTSALGKIVRKGLRREWSYLCDAFVKSFSGKISNFDAITSQILQMLYMFLTNEYFNFWGLMIQ